MSLCPICGLLYCDHSPEERGQTPEEMMRPLNAEETKVWKSEPKHSSKKIRVVRKYKHTPVRKKTKE